MNDHEHAMLQAVNAARVERGVHALVADEVAATAALFPTVEQTAPPDANDLAARIEALAATWGG